MPQYDRDDIKAGMILHGGIFPAITKDHAPVIYGRPMKRRRAPSLDEIERKLEAAKKRLEEIAAAVRKR